MDKKFLESIGVHTEDGLAAILEQLEEKQLEYFERLENVNDSKREEELKQILSKIEKATESVKEELNAIQTAIIVDGPEVEKTEKKEKKAQSKKEKNEALKKDIEKMKNRAQQKPEEKAKPEQKKDTQQTVKNGERKDAQQTAKQDDRKDVQQAARKGDQADPQQTALSAALQNYQKGDYKRAFQQFTELGEKKKHPVAQLMLARMYEKGEGTAVNKDRAEFWYKSAADGGNPDAQYAYAVLMLASGSGTSDNTNTKTGMSYMEKAAEQNYQAAIDKYIELSLQDGMNTQWLTRAMAYCDRGANLVQGSYEKDQYQKKKKELEEKRKRLNKAKNAGTLPTILSLMGNVLYVVSFVYMFWGLHPNYTTMVSFFSKIPMAPEKLIIPWQTLTEWASSGGFLTINGIFAMELLVVAAALTTIGAVHSRKKFAKKISSLVPWVAVAMTVWHIYVWHTATEYLKQFAVKSFIAFFVPIIIGWAIGSAVKSVFKMK